MDFRKFVNSLDQAEFRSLLECCIDRAGVENQKAKEPEKIEELPMMSGWDWDSLKDDTRREICRAVIQAVPNEWIYPAEISAALTILSTLRGSIRKFCPNLFFDIVLIWISTSGGISPRPEFNAHLRGQPSAGLHIDFGNIHRRRHGRDTGFPASLYKIQHGIKGLFSIIGTAYLQVGFRVRGVQAHRNLVDLPHEL